MVRHNGWLFINDAVDKDEVILADGRRVTGETHGDADAKASEEARADDEQDITAEAAEELAKAALGSEGVSGSEPGASESATEVVSKLDQLRNDAEALGVTVDKRWGARRLQKEIDSINSAL
jgi:hypothetical protein